MSECDRLETCPFFNDALQQKPGMTALYRKSYCHGNFNDCARYQIAAVFGPENIPPDLYPNMVDRAKRLLESPDALKARPKKPRDTLL